MKRRATSAAAAPTLDGHPYGCPRCRALEPGLRACLTLGTCCRQELTEKRAEETAATAAMAEGQTGAAELQAKARASADACQDLRQEVEQLREHFASGDQSVQVPPAPLTSMAQLGHAHRQSERCRMPDGSRIFRQGV